LEESVLNHGVTTYFFFFFDITKWITS